MGGYACLYPILGNWYNNVNFLNTRRYPDPDFIGFGLVDPPINVMKLIFPHSSFFVWLGYDLGNHSTIIFLFYYLCFNFYNNWRLSIL